MFILTLNLIDLSDDEAFSRHRLHNTSSALPVTCQNSKQYTSKEVSWEDQKHILCFCSKD